MLTRFFNTQLKLNLILLLCSSSLYFFYFQEVILHLNSVLSSIAGDSLKNYYTYLYHIKNDNGLLHFSGLNYPYGEHVVFTDCVPLLTFILKAMPFTHNHLIGILHGSIFLSFACTPLILNTIFYRLGVDRFSSFFIALAIGLLSPQYFKVLGGHYALSYTFVIPLCILLLINLQQKKNVSALSFLFIFNFLIFFLHPYFGFGTSLFSLLSVFVFEVLTNRGKQIVQTLKNTFVAGALPMILFKVFMLLTDHHLNRTQNPENVNSLVANMGSLLLPNYGPFQELLPKIFRVQPTNFEGFSYIGLFLIMLICVFLILLPFMIRKIKPAKETLSIFISSLFILFLAFGLHNDVLSALHIKSALLNQFRASGRFIWFFYYALPVFVVPTIYISVSKLLQEQTHKPLLKLIAVLFFACNLLEANSLFQLDRTAFWKFRNFFNDNCLEKKEKELIASVKGLKPQALIPLPVYHAGSEVYLRTEKDQAMQLSMMYSYHCKLPILSSFLSRTSISETEELIGTLNAYKKRHSLRSLLSERNFLVLKTNDPLMPDEERLFSKTSIFYKNDSVSFGVLSYKKLFQAVSDSIEFTIQEDQAARVETNNLVFISSENRSPFLPASLEKLEMLYSLDSNKLVSGNYIVSLRYHYKEKVHSAVAGHLILSQVDHVRGEWIENLALKKFSGFYSGFGVFEVKLNLMKNKKYDFMIMGAEKGTYKVSHFLIRREGTTVKIINKNDTAFNNFPVNAF